MGTFLLDEEIRGVQSGRLPLDRLRQECIIALKVYDSIRLQDCLNGLELGPARAAECGHIGDEVFDEGDVIDPPENAATVTADKLKIKKIIIVSKEESAFRKGYWDIDLKYVFEYRLTFREADGNIIGQIRANSIYNRKVTLFGSVGQDLVVSTDLWSHFSHNGTTIDADPFVLVEAKAVVLSAELRYQRKINFGERDYPPEPNYVVVTIGLFSIVKLFRLVNLTVESRGFCIPPQDEELSPLNACDYFEGLNFPMDVFAPPQKPEFFAGVVNELENIREEKCHKCGCYVAECCCEHEHKQPENCGCKGRRR